ncbi:TonB-dependent receptor [Aquidulcibacter sp.]|uniref:TonB-dependent receptor family protein n=1 Tax=Aquidulcibacter sp. TaxID=2052990 RepID=UPI0025BAB2FC|nr:TonB-dependent receptor [Aquidulcibacter sp.]MCA3694807.1 TonB-dependent receptor [Aquidulcibacter sp.]
MTSAGRFAALGLCALTVLMGSSVEAEEVETVIVTGSILKDKSRLPGSAFEVSSADLGRLAPISVADLLRPVPGIQVVSEDLFGLKVNISVRGLTPRRSARTLLLEDGMPIQPAPYSEPSAHYVPPFERIERIEVLKGSGEILYGPQSLGGMINFITKPVPDRATGELDLSVGTRNFYSGHLTLGAGNEQGGARLDVIQKASDGTRDEHSTRFSDVALKARVRLDEGQTLTARFTHFVEDTALTEAGLTAARYAQNPFANPFSQDHFDLTRTAIQLRYDAALSKGISLNTQIYGAETFRASYRQTDTSIDSMTANPSNGCDGAARLDYENFAARCGNKMRPRQFSFAGIESKITIANKVGGHDLTTLLGVRFHREDADRRRYNGLTPNARETSPGTLLRDWNLIQADTVSLYAQSILQLGRLNLSLGVRHEHIETTNKSVVANFVERNLAASSDQSLTLPGLGLNWTVRDGFEVFAGVHQGFAPPRPDRDVDPLAPANQVRPEESTNYELGMRLGLGPQSKLEATAFWLDFQELIVAGPLLGMPSGTLVNAGAATHAGAELYLRHDLPLWMGPSWKPWASISVTHLVKAQFDTAVGEGSGNVRGNRIPYAPRWLGDITFGAVTENGLGFTLSASQVGAQYADARNTITQSSDGTLGLIPSYSLVNLGLTYRPGTANWEVYLTSHNVLDKRYLSTRTDGMFAGPPRQTVIGVRLIL